MPARKRARLRERAGTSAFRGKTFYKWKRRFPEHGDAGLGDRSRRPLRCPHPTPREVVSKILYLRQNYHFGPARLPTT